MYLRNQWLDVAELSSAEQRQRWSWVWGDKEEWLEVISQLTKSSCCRLRNVSRIQGLMSQRDLHTFIFWSLVVLLHSCNNESLEDRRVDHIRSTLRSLHWLHVHQRRGYKTTLLVYEEFNVSRSKYISVMSHSPQVRSKHKGVACSF